MQAGPLRQSFSSDILGGLLEIDSADLQTAIDRDIFEFLVLHEIGHIMGLGTMWNENDLPHQIDAGSATYTGSRGVAAWNDIGCSGALPLVGTNDLSHFSETCLVNELMTPTLQFGRTALVSGITMAALEDLGYQVNRSEQDAYGIDQLGTCGAFCPEKRRRLETSDSTAVITPQLSAEGEKQIIQGAVDKFRVEDRRIKEQGDESSTMHVCSVWSVTYEENGSIHSRTVRRREVEHLL